MMEIQTIIYLAQLPEYLNLYLKHNSYPQG